MNTPAQIRLRLLFRILSIAPLLIILVGTWFWWRLHQSLPLLDGTRSLPGLKAQVKINRDDLGVPTVEGETLVDIARAQGWLHAQDRFFQMDLLRRRSAGELAALFGQELVPLDRAARVHRFRSVAKAAIAQMSPAHRAYLTAYTEGANAGLNALRYRPFEYIVLRTTPQPWLEEDSFLVLYTMWMDLQDNSGDREQTLATLRDTFGKAAVDFFGGNGSAWDAPLDNSTLPAPTPLPPDVVDLRKEKKTAALSPVPAVDERRFNGSNAFAISGAHTPNGSALVANDMHLGLAIPNVWYRVSLAWAGERATGVTLPGLPGMVAGSNGHIAWGFTDAYADTSDLVVIETNAQVQELYRVADRLAEMKIDTETIEVKGSASQKIEVKSTQWGPIIGTTTDHRPTSLHWIAHDPAASNLELISMLEAKSAQEAVTLAHRVGIPAENFIVGDNGGHIAWTIIGKLPKRVGYEGKLPSIWAYGDRRWDGFLPESEIPVIMDPPDGKLWSANNRMVGNPQLAMLGNGGYDNGARAKQIRDDLASLIQKKPKDIRSSDFLAIQLDDQAIFLGRWQELMLQTLADEGKDRSSAHAELRPFVEAWGGRAAIDSVGYRLVRRFRSSVIARVLQPFIARAKYYAENFEYTLEPEDVVWRMVDEKPAHLLNPEFNSWDDLLRACLDDVLRTAKESRFPLDRFTWGEFNRARIEHPFARFLPRFLGNLVSMPPDALPGDIHMPRVQGPSDGASERFSVSPGHEDEGIFEMPGGQSGHPSSPYFSAGHSAWVKGEQTSFLPGKTEHTLTLTP